jgi:hypothetical protein
MSNKVVATIGTMGVDIGKNPFHVAALTLIGTEAEYVRAMRTLGRHTGTWQP